MVNLVPASTGESNMPSLLEKAWNAILLSEFKRSKHNQSTKKCRPMKKQTAPTVKEKPTLHSPLLPRRQAHIRGLTITVPPGRRPVPPSLEGKKSPPSLEGKKYPPSLEREKSPSPPVGKDSPPYSPELPVYNPRPRRAPLLGKESRPRSPAGTPVNNPRPRLCERLPLVGKESPPCSPATRVYNLRPRLCNCEKCSWTF